MVCDLVVMVVCNLVVMVVCDLVVMVVCDLVVMVVCDLALRSDAATERMPDRELNRELNPRQSCS